MKNILRLEFYGFGARNDSRVSVSNFTRLQGWVYFMFKNILTDRDKTFFEVRILNI